MGVGAAFDGDGRFGDVKMFGEKLNQGSVGFTVVGFGTEIDRVFFGRNFGDFFLAGAGLNGDFDFWHIRLIIAYSCVI